MNGLPASVSLTHYFPPQLAIFNDILAALAFPPDKRLANLEKLLNSPTTRKVLLLLFLDLLKLI